MTSILEAALARTITNAAAFLFMDAVLTRDVQVTSSDRADPSAPTQQTYACKALHETYRTGLLERGLVNSNEFSILILANTLSTTPQSGDRIAIAARSLTATIVPSDGGGLDAIRTDPAKATWQCRCRA